MLRTLLNAIARNKEPYFKVSKRVQDFISIVKIGEDGIFLHPNNVYSVSFKFSDVNYSVVGAKEQEQIFEGYCDLINTFVSGATTKITINNRRLDTNYLKQKVCIPFIDGDRNNEYRAEYNQMLVQTISDRKALVQEKYITVSAEKKTYEEAQVFFKGIEDELNIRLNSIKSSCVRLTTNERLKILNDFYRDGEEGSNSDLLDIVRNGGDFQDYICPDYADLTDYTCIRFSDNKFCRVLFLKTDGYSNRISDAFVSQLTTVDKEMMLSLDIEPIPIDEAVNDADSRLLGVETNITRWQGRQNKNYNFSAEVPQKYQNSQKSIRNFLSDLTEYDQQEFQVVLTIGLTAHTKEELNRQTEEIKMIARKNSCQIATASWQQKEGCNTCTPVGVCKIPQYRTLLTEGVGIFMPFRVQDVLHDKGSYFGLNAESGSIIRIDKLRFQNGNSMIFGVPGSGKSFMAKLEMISYILRGDCDVIVVDPQGEYGRLFSALGGEIIKLSPNSPTSINLMDINEEYKEEGGTPVALKSDFMIAFCEQACQGMILGPTHRSLIIRVTENVYREYVSNGYTGDCPTLYNFVDLMRNQPESEAHDIALALEMFTSTSFSMFAQPTNVDTQNHVLCYNIHELGTTLKPVGMLTMLDAIFNRVSTNAKSGRITYVFFDEFHLLTKYDFTADYCQTLWRTLRKFKAFCTGITQNIEEMIKSETARSIVSNSEIIVMLNQAASDRDELARLLRFSPELLSYVTNAPEGHGLIKVSDTVIPFANTFPKNTELYRLMTTKASELVDIQNEKEKQSS